MAKLRSTREIVVWEEVAEVLQRRIDDAISAAAEAADMRAMGKAQGRLEAYREMLGLPKAMVAGAEMQAAEDMNREAINRSQDPRNWKHPDMIRR
jgi:hypothetical protein